MKVKNSILAFGFWILGAFLDPDAVLIADVQALLAGL